MNVMPAEIAGISENPALEDADTESGWDRNPLPWVHPVETDCAARGAMPKRTERRIQPRAIRCTRRTQPRRLGRVNSGQFLGIETDT